MHVDFVRVKELFASPSRMLPSLPGTSANIPLLGTCAQRAMRHLTRGSDVDHMVLGRGAMNVYGRWLLFRGRVQKKELLLLIVMDGVTSETTGLWACVLIAAEILVAGCAMGAHDGRSGVAKTKYFRGIAIAVDVCAARTVTSFAALLFWLVLSKQLLVARLQDA